MSGSSSFKTISDPVDGFRMKGREKLGFVTEMFDSISSSYDILNLIISLGQTSIWRWLAFFDLRSRLFVGAQILDVGCGTGKASQLMHAWYPSLSLSIEGLDPSEKMLDVARKNDKRSKFVRGDVSDMKEIVEDEAFDMVTTIYTLRNFPDMKKGLSEMIRVLRPGGTLLILDAFPPSFVLMKWILQIWLGLIVPHIASLFAEKKAYNYLAGSVQETLPVEKIASHLKDLGCVNVTITKYSLGAACRIIAEKESSKQSK